MYINFNAVPNNSIGIELEVQTISQRNAELVPGAEIILSQLPGEVLFKPELFNSTIEINTPVCQSISELEEVLKKNLSTIKDIAR